MRFIHSFISNRYFLFFILFSAIHVIRISEGDTIEFAMIGVIVAVGYKLISDLDIMPKRKE